MFIVLIVSRRDGFSRAPQVPQGLSTQASGVSRYRVAWDFRCEYFQSTSRGVLTTGLTHEDLRLKGEATTRRSIEEAGVLLGIGDGTTAESILRRVRMPFGFVSWNETTAVANVVRDPIGMQPMYWQADEDFFYVSDSVSAFGHAQ